MEPNALHSREPGDESRASGHEEDRPQAGRTGRLRAVWRSRWRERAENLILLALVVFAGWRLLPQVGAWVGVGPVLGTAPEVVFETLDGAPMELSGLHGEVVVVNFWASWCAPCRWEMPALQSLYDEHVSEGLRVVGVSIDARPRDARAYASDKGITYPIALATAETRQAFGGLQGVPTTFLIDREGVIRHRVFGFFAPPALSTAVRRLLEESRP